MLKPTEVAPGHTVQLLSGGAEFFPALLGAMDSASHEIRLETYIFDFRGQGAAIAEALARAALRGVAVFVVMDGVGTPEVPAEWVSRWNRSGVQWHRYAPFGYAGLLIPGRWRRLHRKLCVVDGSRAFCGGINILDDWIDPHFGTLAVARLDYAVVVTGPLVSQCHDVLAQFWTRLQATRQLETLQWAAVRKNWGALRWLLSRKEAGTLASGLEEGVLAALLLRDNVRNRARIERSYLKAIGEARQHIVLANAYFLPGGRLRRALIHAVRRGVHVQVVVQGQYEYFMQYHASRPVLGQLAAHGVEVREYMPGFLHAKVAVMDGVWATVGSSNLDPLSLLLAREANVVVHDPAFAARLGAALEGVIRAHTRPWDVAADLRRPWFQRLFDRIAYGAMRLILLVSGRRY
jgi:cardiolipin synthase